MEKQLLFLLDYNLRVEEPELISHLQPFWREIRPVAIPTASPSPITISDRRRAQIAASPKLAHTLEPTRARTPPTTPHKLVVSIPTSSKSTFIPPETGLPTPSYDDVKPSMQAQSVAWTSRRRTDIFDPSPISTPSSSRASLSGPSRQSSTPSPYFNLAQLHLEAPTPALARRDSTDSTASLASSEGESYHSTNGSLVGSTSTGQLRVSIPGLPRKASYTSRPGSDSILIVAGESQPIATSNSSPGFLKKFVSRQTPTSLRSIRKSVSVAIAA